MKDAAKLKAIAYELINIANHIHEYLRGDHPTLPTQWDVQQIYEEYRRAVNPEKY